jgi:hypothetical protein
VANTVRMPKKAYCYRPEGRRKKVRSAITLGTDRDDLILGLKDLVRSYTKCFKMLRIRSQLLMAVWCVLVEDHFWVATPCSLIEVYRRFRGAASLGGWALLMKAASTSETSGRLHAGHRVYLKPCCLVIRIYVANRNVNEILRCEAVSNADRPPLHLSLALVKIRSSILMTDVPFFSS